jgi:hypothetical protein
MPEPVKSHLFIIRIFLCFLSTNKYLYLLHIKKNQLLSNGIYQLIFTMYKKIWVFLHLFTLILCYIKFHVEPYRVLKTTQDISHTPQQITTSRVMTALGTSHTSQKTTTPRVMPAPDTLHTPQQTTTPRVMPAPDTLHTPQQTTTPQVMPAPDTSHTPQQTTTPRVVTAPETSHAFQQTTTPVTRASDKLGTINIF